MKKFTLILLTLLANILPSSNLYAQKLTAQETRKLIDTTLKLETVYFEDLIMYCLTKDTLSYNNSVAILQQQQANYDKLATSADEKTFVVWSIYYINRAKNHTEENLKNYGSLSVFLEKSRINDSNDRKFIFQEKEYSITESMFQVIDPLVAKRDASIGSYEEYVNSIE
jgi:hypothetical protein